MSKASEQRRGEVLGRIWIAAKGQKGEFTSRSIWEVVGCSAPHATSFLRKMAEAGYLTSRGPRSAKVYKWATTPPNTRPRFGRDGTTLTDPDMTPGDLALLQCTMQLSDVDLCILLGWSPTSGNNIRKMKAGKKPIRKQTAHKVRALREAWSKQGDPSVGEAPHTIGERVWDAWSQHADDRGAAREAIQKIWRAR